MALACLPAPLALAGLALTVAACAGTAPLPDGPPAVRGTLTDVRHSATASGLTVEADGEACGMTATAGHRTRVLRRSAGGRLTVVGTGAAGVGALEVGDRVAVWAEGPVMESCPLQGHAAVVVIEDADVAAAAPVGRRVQAVEPDDGGVEVHRPAGPASATRSQPAAAPRSQSRTPPTPTLSATARGRSTS